MVGTVMMCLVDLGSDRCPEDLRIGVGYAAFGERGEEFEDA
jgi:hypothetical protein